MHPIVVIRDSKKESFIYLLCKISAAPDSPTHANAIDVSFEVVTDDEMDKKESGVECVELSFDRASWAAFRAFMDEHVSRLS